MGTEHPTPIRVALADDDPRVREAATVALARAPDLELVTTLADGAQVLGLLAAQRMDVLVMDLGMPGGGFDLVRAARAAAPGTSLLVVTAQDDLFTCTELVRIGVRCIVSKYGIDVDLAGCVLRCHHRDVVLVGRGPAAVIDHLAETHRARR